MTRQAIEGWTGTSSFEALLSFSVAGELARRAPRIERAASARDWDDARGIVREMFDWMQAGLDVRPEDVQAGAARELAALSEYYAPPHGAFFIARIAGDAVGTAGVRVYEPGIVEIKRMYVRPAGRGQGISTRLLETVVDEARRMGAHTARLETHTRLMHTAYQMYLAHGFRPRPDYSGLTHAVPGAVAMERRIDVPGALSA